MTRTQVQQLVVVLLLILFVGVFLLSNKPPEPGGTVVTPPPPGESAQAPAERSEPPAAVVPAVLPDLSIPRDIFLLPALLIQRLQQRDQAEQQAELDRLQQQQASQVKPVVLQQITITDLQLQGIFWGSANPQAIINRKIVSVGDQVEGAEVEAITKESVTLSRDGQEFELKPEVLR
ncbi:MAG: hypothetical protein Q7J69_04405 [Candidatus Omnitrophota bacterium]|nr:hypothetical protein [Candidatus Omnitrophota bacterium]